MNCVIVIDCYNDYFMVFYKDIDLIYFVLKKKDLIRGWKWQVQMKGLMVI